MTIERVKKIPGPEHPITIEPEARTVTVIAGGRTIARSNRALLLCEASYPPVYYIPREDVDMTHWIRSDYQTYCPYKGECHYYTIPTDGGVSLNAVWTYEAPFQAVAAIRDHLAFYPDRVDSIALDAAH